MTRIVAPEGTRSSLCVGPRNLLLAWVLVSALLALAPDGQAHADRAFIEGVPDYCQDQFEGRNDCTPVACADVLGYWDSHGRPEMIDGSNDFAANPAGVTALVDTLKFHLFWSSAGTRIDLIQRGIVNTARDRGYFFNSRNRFKASWSDFTCEIDARRPIVFTLYHPRYGSYHSTAGIGYDDTAGTRLVILHDAWLPVDEVYLNFDECLGPIVTTAVPVVFVDDDAPHDPGPGDPQTSDPCEDGSESHPFDSIQEGLDNGGDGVLITVRPGTYCGPGNRDLDFRGVVSVLSAEGGPTRCTIRCDGTAASPHRAFRFEAQPAATVQGFTITGGYASDGGAVYCSNSAPVFRNCVFTGNTASRGGVLFCNNSAAELINCTLADNSALYSGGALHATGERRPSIINCIVWSNAPDQMFGQVCSVSYSLVQGGWSGTEIVDRDPLFAGPPADYHVRSVYGRWLPESGGWVYDEATSPGIDAGAPDSDCSLEPDSGSGRVNMGAYGNTAEASRSGPWWTIPGDANDDCVVNILDMIFVRNRVLGKMTGSGMWKADMNNDGRISISDVMVVRNALGSTCR